MISNFGYIESPKMSGVKTEEDYLKFLDKYKQMLTIHLMKVFYYINYDESRGLHRKKKTIPHWISEIIPLFDIQYLDIDALSYEYKDKILEKFSLRNDYKTFEVWADKLIAQMADPNQEEYYGLPQMTKIKMWKQWAAFVVFNNQFFRDILDRLCRYKSRISSRVFEKYIVTGARLNTIDENKLKKKIDSFRDFSSLEDSFVLFCMQHKDELLSYYKNNL